MNVAEEQTEDAVDDALDMFWEYHADGSMQKFLKIEITQEHLDNGYFPAPLNILSVIRILALGGGLGSSGIANLSNLQVTAYFSDLISNIPKQGISSYVMAIQNLNTIQEIFNAEKRFEYNKHEDKIYIVGNKELMVVGDFIVIEAVIVNDPAVNPETWNNWWLKNYTTALIKKQWGINLGKYQGVMLPSGATLNGEAIRSEANTEISELEQRLRDEFQLPPDFFVG